MNNWKRINPFINKNRLLNKFYIIQIIDIFFFFFFFSHGYIWLILKIQNKNKI